MPYYELATMQEYLDYEITKNHKLEKVDTYTKRKIALLVELGELANELRFFKFWSTDQEPRYYAKCSACKGTGRYQNRYNRQDNSPCVVCWGTGKDESKNPVLEEYIDCIHFTLSLLISHEKYRNNKPALKKLMNSTSKLHYPDLDTQFEALYSEISSNLHTNIEYVLSLILGLGKMLGFTDEKIYEAYVNKNKINLKRQEKGY